MSRALILTEEQWARIQEKMRAKEKRSVLLSREKMKAVLGFTPRRHEEWRILKDEEYKHDDDLWWDNKQRVRTIHLDFFDEQKRTMFLLKYGNGDE